MENLHFLWTPDFTEDHTYNNYYYTITDSSEGLTTERFSSKLTVSDSRYSFFFTWTLECLCLLGLHSLICLSSHTMWGTMGNFIGPKVCALTLLSCRVVCPSTHIHTLTYKNRNISTSHFVSSFLCFKTETVQLQLWNLKTSVLWSQCPTLDVCPPYGTHTFFYTNNTWKFYLEVFCRDKIRSLLKIWSDFTCAGGQ